MFAAFNAMAQEAASPNGNVKVKFALNNSVPTYTITFRGKPVIKPSRLGFALVKGGDLLDARGRRERLGRRDMDTRMGREPHHKEPL